MKRVITGLFLAALFIVLIFYAPAVYFSAAIVLIIIVALREFYAITLAQERIFGIVGTALGGAVPIVVYFFGLEGSLAGLLLIVFFIFTYFLFVHSPLVSVVSRISAGVLGILYISFPVAHLIGLRGLDQGGAWILFLFVIVSANDIFAYYVGKGLGRHKLSPAVSPNKTIEGALGGLAGGIVASIVVRHLFLNDVPLGEVVILSLSIGILGQMSDLFESLIKRGAGVKDSGSILPGHGGVLDRIDSHIFPIPFLYYYLTMF